MKIKKIIAAAVAAVLTVSGGAIALTGCGGCDHVYRDKIITAPNCTEGGVLERTCGICQDKQTVELPPEPDKHAYGDWEISAPTTSKTGTAVKSCTKNAQHTKIEVSLPVLPESGAGEYGDVRITKQPTALHEGEQTYTLANENGDISVKVPVPAKGVETVADGVEAALETKADIRSCNGEWGYEKKGTQFNDLEQSYVPHYFSYEFGENYTHIVDDTNSAERWLSLDSEGELFAFVRSGSNFTKEEEENYLKGHKIPLFQTGINNCYGAEELLSTLYQRAKVVHEEEVKAGIEGGSFSESFTKLGYAFTYGAETTANNEKVGQYSVIEVRFTLDEEEHTLSTLEITSTVYFTYNDPDTNRILSNWEKDENGKVTITNKNGNRVVDTISLTQKTKKQVPQEPQNPYAQEKVYVSSFDVCKAAGTPIAEEEVIEIVADAEYKCRIANIQPETANLTFDPIRIYLVKLNGEEVPLSYDTLRSCGANALYQSGTLSYRSQLAGSNTVKIKTKNVTKLLHFNVKPKAPSRLYPAIWLYGDNGYVWDTSIPDNSVKEVTVYVGQQLCFKVQPSQEEMNYVETGYTVRVYSGVAANVTFGDKVINGETVKSFVASAAGDYRLLCTTTYSGSAIGCAIMVHVVDVPALSEYAGNYSVNMTYPRRGNVSVTVEVTDANTATATIVNMEGNTEVLTLIYGVTESGLALTSQHSSGAKLGYTIAFNEAYRLVISYPTQFEGMIESKVLNNLS